MLKETAEEAYQSMRTAQNPLLIQVINTLAGYPTVGAVVHPVCHFRVE
jgi:hypothetical protein